MHKHQDEIKEALRKIYATPKENMVFFFHRAWPNENEDGSIRMPVKLMPQLKLGYWNAQWASQLIQAHAYERRRQGGQQTIEPVLST